MSRFGILLSLFAVLSVTPGHSATLESPADGALLSGLGFISGWKCNANQITVRVNGGAPMSVATHQPRIDTQSVCAGATDNGFITQMNWALLGDGQHTVVAYDNDVQFASATFTVVTLNQEFMQGANGVLTIPDFPAPGGTAVFQWNESTQHMELSSFDTSGESPVTLEPVTGAVEGGHPTRHVIHGFDVWMSPTVYEAAEYSPTILEQELDIIRAQLLWIVSHDALPPTAIQQLIDSGVAIILDTPSTPSAWWNCAEWEWAGCYSAELNRIGIPLIETIALVTRI